MKLLATCTPFEAIPPSIWDRVKTAIKSAGQQWGVDIAIDDDLTVREAIGRFWQLHRIQENARVAAEATDD